MASKNLALSLLFAISVISAIPLLSVTTFSQDLPDAPKPHKFLDKANVAGFSLSAVGLAADGYTTENLRYGELNPLATVFSGTSKGAALYFGGAFAAEIGGAYLLHRTHHHRLERVIPWATAAIEGFWTIHNLRLKSVPQPQQPAAPPPSDCSVVNGRLECKL